MRKVRLPLTIAKEHHRNFRGRRNLRYLRINRTLSIGFSRQTLISYFHSIQIPSIVPIHLKAGNVSFDLMGMAVDRDLIMSNHTNRISSDNLQLIQAVVIFKH